jgi:hypothetical protein
MSGHAKGSAFERSICKQLSEWWRPGRDDIFWRSSQSGGRATIRSRKGKSTAGSYGDIAATDPCGVDLLRFFTIELKCGRSHGFPGDLIDSDCSQFLATIEQAMSAHIAAGSLTWLLVCKRDRRHVMVYFDFRSMRELIKKCKLLASPSVRMKFRHKALGKIDLVGLPLERFLRAVKPADITELNSEL